MESRRETSGFPSLRMRRLRINPQLRRLVQEVSLDPGKLILPLFVRPGSGIRQEISSMPGQFQLSIDQLVLEAKQAADSGIGGIILFGIPESKDATGSAALQEQGIVHRAIAAVKRDVKNLLVVTDVCCCEYTDHGHCGPLSQQGSVTTVDNDATLNLLRQQAVSLARAGSDVIAPSGMMDGMVGAIRQGLDTHGFQDIPILSYAVKYASAFYGPFREAAESTPQFGDRRGYQMDCAAAAGQAIREVELDLAEGADMIMVKPALAYLDVIRTVRERFPGVPLAAYSVSGEYSMVKAAAAQGWLDERAIVTEMLTAMHRSGASIILTYWAKEIARWQKA